MSDTSSPPRSPILTPTASTILTPAASTIFTPTPSTVDNHPIPSPTLDSSISSIDDDESDRGSELSSDDGDAEEEWQESLKQLEMLVSLVIVPFFGKWVGRRCAYWAWTRFMTWKYPIEVVITDPKAFNLAGAVGAVLPRL
ncbi:hypothetical protein RUND412_002857 [Rhizina undulata]